MTNYSAGHEAEKVAAKYLEENGYQIIELNWRTRVCEIDIVANKQNKIYFVEVKYRRTANQGGGLEYITPTKLNQMQFAATCWVQENDYRGDYELSAIEVSNNFQVTRFEQALT